MTRGVVVRIALIALVWSAGCVPAAAASLVLSDAQKRDAVRIGERSVTEEGFDAEWRVRNDAGDTVTVITPFHRLVLAAREATFKSEPLKPDQPDKLLREQRDRLLLWTELKGRGESFARFYGPTLQVADRTIKPAFVQNERTALRDESGGYLARCVYGFPTKDITGKSRVTLIVRDADGRTASTVTIDLSAMR